MEFVVKEFEREYANGQKLPSVRAFVNKYYIKGGEHARQQRLTDHKGTQRRIIEKKLTLLEYLLT